MSRQIPFSKLIAAPNATVFNGLRTLPIIQCISNAAWYCAGITDSLIVYINYKTLSLTLKGFKPVESDKRYFQQVELLQSSRLLQGF